MTELTVFQQKISALIPDIELKFDEPMAKHTSFRIGGGAEVMAFPRNAQELSRILKTSVFRFQHISLRCQAAPIILYGLKTQ